MQTYTIKEVSEMFQLPASTLRYYEDMGILTNVERTVNNQRIYTEGHINRLKTICCFKETGMSIAKLQKFFSYEEKEAKHLPEILALLSEQREQVLKQMEQLQVSMQQIDRKYYYYQAIQEALEKDTPPPKWSDYKNKIYY